MTTDYTKEFDDLLKTLTKETFDREIVTKTIFVGNKKSYAHIGSELAEKLEIIYHFIINEIEFYYNEPTYDILTGNDGSFTQWNIKLIVDKKKYVANYFSEGGDYNDSEKKISLICDHIEDVKIRDFVKFLIINNIIGIPIKHCFGKLMLSNKYSLKKYEDMNHENILRFLQSPTFVKYTKTNINYYISLIKTQNETYDNFICFMSDFILNTYGDGISDEKMKLFLMIDDVDVQNDMIWKSHGLMPEDYLKILKKQPNINCFNMCRYSEKVYKNQDVCDDILNRIKNITMLNCDSIGCKFVFDEDRLKNIVKLSYGVDFKKYNPNLDFTKLKNIKHLISYGHAPPKGFIGLVNLETLEFTSRLANIDDWINTKNIENFPLLKSVEGNFSYITPSKNEFPRLENCKYSTWNGCTLYFQNLGTI